MRLWKTLPRPQASRKKYNLYVVTNDPSITFDHTLWLEAVEIVSSKKIQKFWSVWMVFIV